MSKLYYPRRASYSRSDKPPKRVRRQAHTKHGVVIALRLGDPMRPHVLVIAGTRYDNQGGAMQLTGLTIEHVETIPGGGLASAIARAKQVLPKADARAKEGLHSHFFVIDCTRQPESYMAFIEAGVQYGVLLQVTTAGRLLASVPFWHIGRLTLLSYLQIQLSRPGVVSIARSKADDPTILTPEQIRDALAAAQAKPPKPEADSFVVETTTADDVALAIATAAMYAGMHTPDPWVGEPEYVVG